MRLTTLAVIVAVAMVIVAGLLVMHGSGDNAVVNWLRSLHGAR